MPAEADPLLTLIVVALLVNLAMMAALILPPLVRRRSPFGPGDDEPSAAARHSTEAAVIVGGERRFAGDSTVSLSAYDRVVRIVSWVFIIATSLIVAISNLWPEAQPAIFIVLALGGLFVLIVHDLLPTSLLGPGKFIVEGSLAITLATLLVVLTGRETSPFFFVFPLIVGGAALVVGPPVTIALAVVASLGYVIAVTAGPDANLSTQAFATMAVNLTALALLAYVATVIGREQRRARDEAIRLSTVDPLTGLFNRAYFFAAIDREIARSNRSGRGFCLVMMDLDELKVINDRLGHHEGDRALRGIGEVIRDGVRRIDTAARYGGDEFVILLPETDPTGAFVLAEKIRQGAAAMAIGSAAIRPTLSVGVVAYPYDGRTPDELMISADQAMYASKRLGKNRVMGLPLRAGGPGAESV